MEEAVWISLENSGERIKLEGRFCPGTPGLKPYKGAIICHPHPLYGGDMENDVVIAIRKAFASVGISTLRFNFRGVGASEGSYDGDQGEVRDLLAACYFMRSRGIELLYGAGYSFGSWILLKAFSKELFSGLVLIAPPVDFLDFEDLKLPSDIPVLLIVGSRDEFCSREKFKLWLKKNSKTRENLTLLVIEGENHFFWRSMPKLTDGIREFLKRWLKESP